MRAPVVLMIGTLGALGVGAYFALRRSRLAKSDDAGSGGTLLMRLYDPTDSQHDVFVRAGRQAGEELGVSPVNVLTGQSILAAINRGPARLSRVLFLVHGSDTQLVRPGHSGVRVSGDALPTWISVDTLANALADRLLPSGIVSLGACNSANIARLLRDALVVRGVVGSGEIRAKTTAGRTRSNPNGIAYPLRAGAAGRIVRFDAPGAASIAWTCLIGEGLEISARA